jgi:hypothetical protein
METVERLCDRVALINKGEKLLDGAVAEVKRQHGNNTLVLAFDGDGVFLAALPGVAKLSDFGRYVEIRMKDGADPQAILREAAARLRLSRFEIVEPSLHDIFVESVKAHGEPLRRTVLWPLVRRDYIERVRRIVFVIRHSPGPSDGSCPHPRHPDVRAASRCGWPWSTPPAAGSRGPRGSRWPRKG